jgi:T4 bacteriophage base plate protein
MTLPILETPTYELILPSTNKKVKYRPFLVKEYKILLTSVGNDSKEVSRIVIELVDSCTFKSLDMNKLAHFDIEYLFLNIRAKSISETTDLIINCDCGEKIEYSMDLTKIEVKKENTLVNKIMLTDDIGVTMRYPKFDEIIEIHNNVSSDKVIELVCNCIDAVYTKDDYHDSFTKEDLEVFVNSFTKKQFDKLEDFFKNIPKIVHDISVKCSACGTVNNTKLEGLENFFV